MNNILRKIANTSVVMKIRKIRHDIKKLSKATEELKRRSAKNIYYFGAPVHRNLGDLAQAICIRNWLAKHYPEYTVLSFETDAVVNTRFSIIGKIAAGFGKDDFIVFQSGYTTTDLGGHADEMHRAVINAMPDVKMLMLPQTVFFKSESNKKLTSKSYNSAKNMLFLARDSHSYDTALEMFPDICVKLYPDIVTTLIGKSEYRYDRNGILFCLRNDEEKYYSDKDLAVLIEKCKKTAPVSRTDTTKSNFDIKDAESFIFSEIDAYAHYKLIITDRYHGTILSLVAGTPVIILKTTDHKVITGAEWFNGVYDDYVYVAKDLDHAYNLAKQIYSSVFSYKLEPYFEKEYYDKLPKLFAERLDYDYL